MFPLVMTLAFFGLLAWINSQPKTPPGGSGWDAGLMRDWAQRQGMNTTWVALGSVALIAGLYWGIPILIGFGAAAISVPFFVESIARVWDRVLQGIGGATLQSIGSAVSMAAGRLAKRLGPVGSAAKGLTGLVSKLKGGVGAVQSLVDRVRPSAPPQMRGVLRATSGALFAGAAALSILALLEGDTGEPAGLVASGRGGAATPGSAGGGVAQVDTAWLEALAREWFTYDGLDSWLGRLEPYLAPGTVSVLRECVQERLRLAWRVARTSIVEGPQVETVGKLGELEYGLSGRGGAVHHPDILSRYGVDLRPEDVGVRFSAVVARELPAEKAALPGSETLTRPQRLTVQFFITGGRAIPDAGECGQGVAFVG